ncbi:hypothetical protein KAU32_03345 [bacterium]|nr:hypothetical protein [bacterium]
MKFITTPERKKADGDMVTLCALCSEDPNFCGDNGDGNNAGGNGNGACPWYGCRSKFLHIKPCPQYI